MRKHLVEKPVQSSSTFYYTPNKKPTKQLTSTLSFRVMFHFLSEKIFYYPLKYIFNIFELNLIFVLPFFTFIAGETNFP